VSEEKESRDRAVRIPVEPAGFGTGVGAGRVGVGVGVTVDVERRDGVRREAADGDRVVFGGGLLMRREEGDGTGAKDWALVCEVPADEPALRSDGRGDVGMEEMPLSMLSGRRSGADGLIVAGGWVPATPSSVRLDLERKSEGNDGLVSRLLALDIDARSSASPDGSVALAVEPLREDGPAGEDREEDRRRKRPASGRFEGGGFDVSTEARSPIVEGFVFGIDPLLACLAGKRWKEERERASL
jgi:hypothetical protein